MRDPTNRLLKRCHEVGQLSHRLLELLASRRPHVIEHGDFREAERRAAPADQDFVSARRFNYHPRRHPSTSPMAETIETGLVYIHRISPTKKFIGCGAL